MNNNLRAARLAWSGGMAFAAEGTTPASPSIAIDGDAEEGPSPMHLLLMAAASCSAVDVVHILGKMKQEPVRFDVEVSGERRDTDPRSYRSVHLRFVLGGPELTLDKVTRAVDLSLQKYCSVVASLDPAIEITSEITLA